MRRIEEVATMTAKGQITVPKTIRDALGADTGTRMKFELHEDGRLLVSLIDEAHQDPALGAYLDLLDKDIDVGCNVNDIPEDLAEILTVAAQRYAPVDEPIIGDVDLWWSDTAGDCSSAGTSTSNCEDSPAASTTVSSNRALLVEYPDKQTIFRRAGTRGTRHDRRYCLHAVEICSVAASIGLVARSVDVEDGAQLSALRPGHPAP